MAVFESFHTLLHSRCRGRFVLSLFGFLAWLLAIATSFIGVSLQPEFARGAVILFLVLAVAFSLKSMQRPRSATEHISSTPTCAQQTSHH